MPFLLMLIINGSSLFINNSPIEYTLPNITRPN